MLLQQQLATYVAISVQVIKHITNYKNKLKVYKQLYTLLVTCCNIKANVGRNFHRFNEFSTNCKRFPIMFFE